MKCAACGNRMVRRQTTPRSPYHYTASGLSNVFLSGIALYECPACKAEVPKIPRVGELHRVIAEILAGKPAHLRGEEVRYLRKNIGIPGKVLASVLGIAPETLSRVENGRLKRLRPAAEHLVRLMARSAARSESLRESVLKVAHLLEQREAPSGRVEAIRLAPGKDGGWRTAV